MVGPGTPATLRGRACPEGTHGRRMPPGLQVGACSPASAPLKGVPCRGEGWSQVEPAAQAELLSQLQDGEFWVEEDEFLREFDEVTIGFPSTEAGHLQSLHSGEGGPDRPPAL